MEKLSRDLIHDYQNHCVSFLESRQQSMLILEMGLGKTAISLTAVLDLMFDSFEVSKVLVIGPLRVVNNVWPKEVAKWEHTSFLRMSVVSGTARQRESALSTKADIYAINRENVKWLVDRYEKKRQRWPFDMVIIDELSSFKNHTSARWRAMRRIRPMVSRMVGLTGTPSPNGLMDLWAQVYLIDNGQRLGRFIGRYREAYFKPKELNPFTGIVYRYEPLPGAEDAIYERISDITVSMKALDYLDMPECVMVDHEVQMDEAEKKVYETMKEDLLVELEGQTIDASNAAVLSGKLQQLSGGALYGEDGEVHIIHSRKLDMLEDLVEQANGQSVLVCYWFRHERQRIIEHLTKKGFEVRELLSSDDINDWNDGKVPVGLISPASAGHGLNLQDGGHILIWFSPIWSLELYQQTNARLWRQGQKNVVTIHHIVTDGTVDERIMKALKSKEQVQEALIEAVKAEIVTGRLS
jgi:SNF2 family DNA or RNA helicase